MDRLLLCLYIHPVFWNRDLSSYQNLCLLMIGWPLVGQPLVGCRWPAGPYPTRVNPNGSSHVVGSWQARLMKTALSRRCIGRDWPIQQCTRFRGLSSAFLHTGFSADSYRESMVEDARGVLSLRSNHVLSARLPCPPESADLQSGRSAGFMHRRRQFIRGTLGYHCDNETARDRHCSGF